MREWGGSSAEGGSGFEEVDCQRFGKSGHQHFWFLLEEQ